MKPDYLFEVSWEVCNKVGGIYTVVSTKALTLQQLLGNQYILIGPDVWMETQDNPEFIEDKTVYRPWRDKAENEGLHFRMGRWNIPGSPLVILVDFTPYFSIKDKIFADYWISYQLDSITGQWDYIEPAMFGHAAALVIESFYSFHLSAQDRLIAQFHEWMTGTGVLYLKEHVPQAGTVFTTHATTMGRSVAGNLMPLYRDMAHYQPDVMASNLGIRAKHSLEKNAALAADAFTTVGEITVNECEKFLGKKPDVLTPNGFELSIVPDKAAFGIKQQHARDALFKLAHAVLGYRPDPDSLLVVNSGRYEFRNKGIDLYIDAMWKLNKEKSLTKQVIAFIMVPANHKGVNPTVLSRLHQNKPNDLPAAGFLSHDLYSPEHDPVLTRLKTSGINNNRNDKVKVIFVPAYLNGNDGLLNLHYYDLLIGFDLSVFPSYYEPWGYTPLESLAFHIPTITTSLTGFGIWARAKDGEHKNALYVVERTEENSVQVVEYISAIIRELAALSADKREAARKSAQLLAQKAVWSIQIEQYYAAYELALKKVAQRYGLYRDKLGIDFYTVYDTPKTNLPVWKKLYVNPRLPDQLSDLHRLAKNLWWSWNSEATALFDSIDHASWEESQHNPIVLIENLQFDQIKRLSQDESFIASLKQVVHQFDEYMGETVNQQQGRIAYFSMEYGLHDTLKTYSGGLGMLAGDYLKEASDSNANIIGVGLLYRYGYFNQQISFFGDQLSELVPQKFTHLPVQPLKDSKGELLTISIALPGRTMIAKAWRLDVGRIPLYLLDTDIEENLEVDRQVTHQLYGGDWENRFKQELLLGVGGIRLLEALGERPAIYHINEGHAAFIGLERLRKLVQDEKLSFPVAIELVRSSTLFTTHTPVPAGHDAFPEDILRTYIPHYPDRLNISWDEFMNLGRYHENRMEEKFSMSVLAVRLSQEVNGVSRIHGKVSRQMFRELYDGCFADELHIGYVTNGVHMPTWTADRWKALYSNYMGEILFREQSNPEHWEKIYQVPDEEIWNIRNSLRRELIEFIQVRLSNDLTRRQENPGIILDIMEQVNDEILTIGFARRFATYKRAHLLFSGMDRLKELVNNTQRPVQFLFAGKAHPNDKAGQDLIKRIIEVSRMPDFQGRVIFLENYDMALAKKLVSGVDVWLNTPTRPLEASGTSGEKATMNGVLNFSVLDGWWAEGYRSNAGWALPEARTYANQHFQDELDTETIYDILEEEIIPMFYDRNERGIPAAWVATIKNAIAGIAPHFTMKRMIDDYYKLFYSKLFERSSILESGNRKEAARLANWKQLIFREFENIEVISVKTTNSSLRPLALGDDFQAEIQVDIHQLEPHDIGIEVVFGIKENDEVKAVSFLKEMTLTVVNNKRLTFSCSIPLNKPGVFDFAFRLFPKNELLAHRQDINLVRWI
ncbi:MAG TPA: alpha-glucan family phosphorylase [Bacteroidales bacterium]|nr:alpha-glucan family phosphorylase [Bacteroidales bacterium]HSA42739.1 alpha-glucan family phosphorylase [Bacteroidales bacterium]